MKILLIFRFFHYIWFTDRENLCFIIIYLFIIIIIIIIIIY